MVYILEQDTLDEALSDSLSDDSLNNDWSSEWASSSKAFSPSLLSATEKNIAYNEAADFTSHSLKTIVYQFFKYKFLTKFNFGPSQISIHVYSCSRIPLADITRSKGHVVN